MVMGVFGCGLAGAGQVPPEAALLEGEQVCSLPVGKEEVGSAVFSPDGSRLLAADRMWLPYGKYLLEGKWPS